MNLKGLTLKHANNAVVSLIIFCSARDGTQGLNCAEQAPCSCSWVAPSLQLCALLAMLVAS